MLYWWKPTPGHVEINWREKRNERIYQALKEKIKEKRKI